MLPYMFKEEDFLLPDGTPMDPSEIVLFLRDVGYYKKLEEPTLRGTNIDNVYIDEATAAIRYVAPQDNYTITWTGEPVFIGSALTAGVVQPAFLRAAGGTFETSSD